MRNAILLLVAAFCSLAADDPARPSPPLSIQRLNGPEVRLTQFRGKVVALTFILTTCSHCQELTQVLNRLAPQFVPRGVQFVECAINSDAATAMQEFLRRFQPQFPVGWTSEAVARSYVRIPITGGRPLYVPHMVFLDRRGIVRGDFSGETGFFTNSEANIRTELEKLLKADANPSPVRP
jgi:thiol-disulfide isomerase/thioredoxin